MHTGRFILSELIAHLPHKQFQKCVARYDDGSQWRKFSYLKPPGYRSALPLIRTRYICGRAQPRARKLEFHPGGVAGEGRRQKLLARDYCSSGRNTVFGDEGTRNLLKAVRLSAAVAVEPGELS